MDVPTLVGDEKTLRRRKLPPGLQTGFKSMFLPGFQTKFNLSKSGYDMGFNVGGGEFKVCKNPPNQEIKVKQGLSRVITPKHPTVQNWTKSGRVGKLSLIHI